MSASPASAFAVIAAKRRLRRHGASSEPAGPDVRSDRADVRAPSARLWRGARSDSRLAQVRNTRTRGARWRVRAYSRSRPAATRTTSALAPAQPQVVLLRGCAHCSRERNSKANSGGIISLRQLPKLLPRRQSPASTCKGARP
jgi:hypothetical protein